MDPTTAILIFNVLCCLAGGTSLIFIFIAYFSKKVSRLPTWYLIMGIGVLYAVSMLMLVGSQLSEEEPSWELCLAQASLTYSLPVGLTTAGAAFAIQLHLSLKFFILNQKTRLHRNSKLLLFVPLVCICAMVMLVFALGFSNPGAVGRSDSQMYCRLDDGIATRVSGILCGASGLALLLMQGFTIALLWPRWTSAAAEELPEKTGNLISRATVVRLVVLDVMAFSAVILGVIKSTLRPSTTVMNLYIATLMFVGLLTFGISTLPFRKSHTKPSPPTSDVESISTSSTSEPEKISAPLTISRSGSEKIIVPFPYSRSITPPPLKDTKHP